MQIQSILSKNVVSNETVTTANARELHKYIGSKRQFSDWIKNRIQKYGFIENQDYIKTSHKVGNANAYDYHITLDMAKELSMVENNEKGREARQYFIEVDKQYTVGLEQYKELQNIILAQNRLIASSQTQPGMSELCRLLNDYAPAAFQKRLVESLKNIKDIADGKMIIGDGTLVDPMKLIEQGIKYDALERKYELLNKKYKKIHSNIIQFENDIENSIDIVTSMHAKFGIFKERMTKIKDGILF